MYSKRRQPRKQKKSRSGLRKTQKGGLKTGSFDFSKVSNAFTVGRNMLADKINEYKGKLDAKTTEINDTINQFNSATRDDLKEQLRSNLEAKLAEIELLVIEAAAKAEEVKDTSEYKKMKESADKLKNTAIEIKGTISALISPRDGSSTSFTSPISVPGQIEQSPTPTTSNDVETLQKRLDTIEPMLNNLNIDFKMLLDGFTTNFYTRYPPDNYDVFKENMSKLMKNILDVKYKREQS